MGLTFQVPTQYCSLQHRALLPSPVTSTAGCCFCFGSISSFFLELFLHSSPIAYWTSTDRGSSSFRVISFCLFLLFLGGLLIPLWGEPRIQKSTCFLHLCEFLSWKVYCQGAVVLLGGEGFIFFRISENVQKKDTHFVAPGTQNSN